MSDPAPSPPPWPQRDSGSPRAEPGDGPSRGRDQGQAGETFLRATALATAWPLGALAFALTFGVFAFGFSNFERTPPRAIHTPGCGITGAVEPLDCTISQADLVLRGRVVHVEWRPNALNGNGHPWRISTVEVAEAVKGSPGGHVRYVQEEFESDHYHGRASEDKREKLFFLKRMSEADKWESALAQVGWEYSDEPLPLHRSAPDPHARYTRPITIDLRPLDNGEQLVGYAREVAADEATAGGGPPPPMLRIHPYRPGDLNPAFRGDRWILYLPKDARTEAAARRWAVSDHVSLRAHAVAVLSHFPCERNAGVLQGMLADPAFVEKGHGVARVRYYFLRQAAHAQLSLWGVHARAPVCEEGPCGYAQVGWREAAAAAALLIAPVALALLPRGRRPVARGALLVCIMICAATAGLWVRSHKNVDDLVFTGGSRHRVASAPGGLLYAHVKGWQGPGGFVRGGYRRTWDSKLNLFPELVAAYDGFEPATATEFPYDPSYPGAKPPPQETILAGGAFTISGVARNGGGQDRPWRAVYVPYGFFVAAFALPPLACALWRVRRGVRRRRLWREGRCVSCGYDLRASPGRCPECGQGACRVVVAPLGGMTSAPRSTRDGRGI